MVFKLKNIETQKMYFHLDPVQYCATASSGHWLDGSILLCLGMLQYIPVKVPYHLLISCNASFC